MTPLIELTWILFWLLTLIITIEYHAKSGKLNRVYLYLLLLNKIVGAQFLLKLPGDYNYYITLVKRDYSHLNFGLSTDFIPFVNQWMGVFQFDIKFAYILPTFYLSFLGLIFFYKTLLYLNRDLENKWWLLFILFLPGMTFWTSPIGKDGLVFFGNTLFLYHYMTKGNLLGFFQIIGLLLVGFIRPHILVLILAGFALSSMLALNLKLYKRIFTIMLLTTFFIAAAPFIAKFLRVDLNDIASIADRIEQFSSFKQESTTYVDMTQYSLPMKIFTYLFRPLPYEIQSLSTIPFIIENIILIFMLIFPLLNVKKWKYFFSDQRMLFMLLASLIIPAVLSQALGNYGLFFRQKWMSLPYLIIFIVYINKMYSQRYKLRTAI